MMMNTRKITVLYVDDDPVMLAVVSLFLERNSYLCKTASSVQEATEALQFLVPDIILSDYEMPEVTGSMFRRYLLSVESLREIPFWFFSDSTSLWLQYEAGQLDARVIPKSAGLKFLLQEIQMDVKDFGKPESAEIVQLAARDVAD